MQLLTVGEAAKLLDRSTDTVRAYADHGKLKSLRTQRGQRLFVMSDVQQFAKELPGRTNQQLRIKRFVSE